MTQSCSTHIVQKEKMNPLVITKANSVSQIKIIDLHYKKTTKLSSSDFINKPMVRGKSPRIFSTSLIIRNCEWRRHECLQKTTEWGTPKVSKTR